MISRSKLCYFLQKEAEISLSIYKLYLKLGCFALQAKAVLENNVPLPIKVTGLHEYTQN